MEQNMLVLVILVIIVLIVIGTGAYFIFNKSDIKIEDINKIDSSRTIISYSILGGLENPTCVLNVKRGNNEKIEFPLSCPVVIDSEAPNGRRMECTGQSQSAILGSNELEVWKTIVDLSDADIIQVCCLNSEIPINSLENLELTKKDFICSSPYTIE
jgi:hypothetical protein